jgi:two-component system, NarL family, response regulator DevR
MRAHGKLGTSTQRDDGRGSVASRIVLVEDHPIVRMGLRALLDAEPDLEVVGEAHSYDAALELHEQLAPDLVVLPLRLGGELSGVGLCRELVSATGGTRVLVYSAFNAADEASAAFLSGAHSFVHKAEEVDRLLDAIRSTLSGRRVFLLGAEVGASVVRLRDSADRAGLTARESEVLTLMLQHLTNAQIAAALVVEVATVKTHVRNVLAKLGIASRRELF